MLQVSKDGSSTNVTGRLALATTPQAVLRTYEGIAYGFTNQNLAQYFQGLLAQAGMNVTVQLMSLSGVPLAAAPTQADLVSCAVSSWPHGELAVEVAARQGRERDMAVGFGRRSQEGARAPWQLLRIVAGCGAHSTESL